ncbi:Rne/Rng family ribonuclease [Nocardioides sp. cx-169]|uniref:Rne/Rng family ribonuclease n=1 Tax=Nocardioides sp. cx-169 TaxID=2899080 RepID=UPI001E542565|nr:Rne/Rng family ribonuclease [Nocardioides sp. cx-169]MCD4535899.1 Rne/Rng family ribonuclease [Nocardioides sp. cx-169]
MADETTTPDAPDSAEGAVAPDAAAPAKKAAKKAPAKRAAAKRTTKKVASATPAATPAETPDVPTDAPEGDGTQAAPAKKTAAKRTAKKAPAKRAAAKKTSAASVEVESVEAPAEQPAAEAPSSDAAAAPMVLFQTPATKVTTRTRGRRAAAKTVEAPPAAEAESTEEAQPLEVPAEAGEPARKRTPRKRAAKKAAAAPQDDEVIEVPAAPETPDAEEADAAATPSEDPEGAEGAEDPESAEDADDGEGGGPRRRRRRGGRRRRKAGDGDDSADSADAQDGGDDAGAKQGKGAGRGSAPESDDDAGEGGTRRRRRRRREGDDGGNGGDDPSNTVTRVRKARSAEDEITAIAGSTRLEAKKQRRREGREAGRRRAPIVSEAEFLARREAVDRVMVIRQREELTQIAVLEDKVLVEHYVARESQTSLIGNVYLGRVQNVLPSMEAAFIDIGKGRNAVLYAGEVNWSALGHKDGQPRKIESVLTSGQSILVQVTKDPIGHKGARLTSQVSLAGRFLVYVPDGTTSGISRKLPDTERNRLKTLLKEIVPDTAGVIVRTAAEGASEEELTRDVERLKARWEDIEGKSKGQAPQLLYGEPDLTLKVVRDLFTEDFSKLVIQGEDAWSSVQSYVSHIAPDLTDRVERYDADGDADRPDVFAAYRVDEQIAKGLDRKVWLPSGGSLVIDRTEAMTVVDVNTGKFTGSGGNLEETVTKNNLEAAEEIVRQLRLRDIGGIIVVDFIDMVLESNRDLVLRRMVECLGRDRTRHQVAEVTSLGLVQMTRKRIGTGLLEAFGETCEHCQGRGLILHDQPVEPRRQDDGPRGGGGNGGGGGRRTRGGRGRDRDEQVTPAPKAAPSPKDIAAMAKPENAARVDVDAPADEPETPPVEVEVAEVVTAVEVEAVVEAGVETETTPQAEETADPAASAEPEQQPEPEPEPEQQPEPEPEPEPAPEPAQPEAPRVVTRTRRTTRSTATISTTPAEMPVVVPAAETAAVEAVSAPEPPKVVTRSRGRSRAATPADEAPTDVVSDVDEGEDADSGPAVEHVPVKKRTRKR